MDRVAFIQHKGKSILVVDLSNSRNIEENKTILNKAKDTVETQAPQSLLLLTNVANAHYDPEGAEALKKYSAFVTPYVKHRAVVGITGIKRILYQAVLKLTGKHIQSCETVDEALDWLAAQK